MENETKESLSGDLAEIRTALEALAARVASLESAPAPVVPDYSGSFSALDTTLDDIANRVNILEGAGYANLDATVAEKSTAENGVDAAWIKHVFEKYFWNEKPALKPANAADAG